MGKEVVISASTANRLFWLGRYAERGYLTLHLMRRAYDEVIDRPGGDGIYGDVLEKLGLPVTDNDNASLRIMAQVYDPLVVGSLYNIVERMMDNAIVLRPLIYSESVSYIELCRDFLHEKAASREMNITELQPITDWLLSFWGSISERVYGRAYDLLETGRLVEHLDMNVRFEYAYRRTDEVWGMLRKHMEGEPELFDRVQAGRFEMYAGSEQAYLCNIREHKPEMASAICALVKV